MQVQQLRSLFGRVQFANEIKSVNRKYGCTRNQEIVIQYSAPSIVKLIPTLYPTFVARLCTSTSLTHQHGQTQAPVSPDSTVQHRPLSYCGQANSSNTAGASHGLGQRGHLERTFLLFLLWFINVSKTWRGMCRYTALFEKAEVGLRDYPAKNEQKRRKQMLKIQNNVVAQQGRHSLYVVYSIFIHIWWKCRLLSIQGGKEHQ